MAAVAAGDRNPVYESARPSSRSLACGAAGLAEPLHMPENELSLAEPLHMPENELSEVNDHQDQAAYLPPAGPAPFVPPRTP
jgi:hypothetical protein